MGDADLPRARRSARARDRAPRRQAGEPGLRGRRLDQDPGLRSRAIQRRRGRRAIGQGSVAHRHPGRHPRDAGLHVPGAGPGAARRRALRRLQRGRRPVRDGHRPPRLRRAHRGRHDGGRPPLRSPGGARGWEAGALGARPDHPPLPGEGPWRSLPDRVRSRLRSGEPVRLSRFRPRRRLVVAPLLEAGRFRRSRRRARDGSSAPPASRTPTSIGSTERALRARGRRSAPSRDP